MEWHHFYDIKWVGNADFHYTAYSSPMIAPFITQWELLIILELKHFQNIQEPSPFSTAFQGLEKWRKKIPYI